MKWEFKEWDFLGFVIQAGDEVPKLRCLNPLPILTCGGASQQGLELALTKIRAATRQPGSFWEWKRHFLISDYRQKMKVVWMLGQNHRHPRTEEPCTKLQAMLPVGHSLGKNTHIRIHKITLAPEHYCFKGFKWLFQLSEKWLCSLK